MIMYKQGIHPPDLAFPIPFRSKADNIYYTENINSITCFCTFTIVKNKHTLLLPAIPYQGE
jgi:uncharacterized protein (UPF0305 family)